MMLPILSVVCRTGGKKGNKRSRPGVQIVKTSVKTIPPESEIRNIQSTVENKQTNRNKNRKASETILDTIGRERETGGQVETLYSLL